MSPSVIEKENKIMTLFLNESEVEKYNEILREEQLEHLIGHVKYTVDGNELIVDPIDDYATELIGEGQFLSFNF
jgi:hypothetical protein